MSEKWGKDSVLFFGDDGARWIKTNEEGKRKKESGEKKAGGRAERDGNERTNERKWGEWQEGRLGWAGLGWVLRVGGGKKVAGGMQKEKKKEREREMSRLA